MTSIKKHHLVSIAAVLLALSAAPGCGGGSDGSTTGPGGESPRPEQVREHGSMEDHQGQGDDAEAKSLAENDPPRTGEKKAKGGRAVPEADAHKDKNAQRPDDVAKRVRELVDGDSGDRTVDSARELRKVLREIKREKQEQNVPPVLEEVLEQARGG